jgi:hypothetical protein
MKNVDLYQFKDEKTQLWGCKFCKNHKIAISPQYGYAWPFNQYGIAVVRKDPHKLFQQNLINTKGVKIAYCYIFDNGPDYYSKFVLSRIVKNGKMGCINFKGKIVVRPKFDCIQRFLPPGIASVSNGCTLGEGGIPHDDGREMGFDQCSWQIGCSHGIRFCGSCMHNQRWANP